MTEPEWTPPALPEGWQSWTVARKKELRDTLRSHRSIETGGWHAPSDIAVDMFPGYAKAPHLAPIDQAYIDAEAGEIDRVLITMPPQLGKSTTASEAGPIWWLHKRPQARITVASYASGLAERRGMKARDTILANGHRLGLELARGSKAAASWDLTSGGGMLCMGVGGGLTGFGSDLMIVDDPHKNREEANSYTMRKAAGEWWQSTVLTRMSPGSPVILILTRWHEDDLAARVLALEGADTEGGRWRVVNLPALAEGKDTDGRPIIDALGRQPGDPLTHPKMPHATRDELITFWIGKRREVGAREWPALYQQRPAPPEGAIWQHDWINGARIAPGQPVPPLGKRIVAVDPSATAHSRSDECGIVVCAKGDDGRGYVLEDRSRVATPLDWGKTVCYAAIMWECTQIVAEQNQGYEMVRLTFMTAWLAVMRELEEAALEAGRTDWEPPMLMPQVVLVNSRVGKTIRAEPVATLYEDGQVSHVGNDLGELEDELTRWTGEGKSPNRLDAVVHGLTHLLKQPGGPARDVVVRGDETPLMQPPHADAFGEHA